MEEFEPRIDNRDENAVCRHALGFAWFGVSTFLIPPSHLNPTNRE